MKATTLSLKLLVLALTSCAKPNLEAIPGRALCSETWGPIRFEAGSSALAPTMRGALDHYQKMARDCRIDSVTLVNLPRGGPAGADASAIARSRAIEAALSEIGFSSVDLVINEDLLPEQQILITARPK